MELIQKSVYELSVLLQNKQISAQELINAYFQQIEAVDSNIGAYLTLCREDAINQALEIDRRRAKGETLSPFAGIPVGIKDNICTRNVKTTCASKMLEHFIPPYDATVIQKIKEHDMIILGKLNMDEFAMGSSTETSYFKTTRNPLDLNRVPGGSSGGSAAAVAALEAPFALGTDTGGSIRQPAAFCGMVGLKPTYGTVSRFGLIAFASSLDQIGPIARNTEDAALLYSVISGHDPLDATSVKRPPFAFEHHATDLSQLRGKKIGLPQEYFCEKVAPHIQQSVKDMANLLTQYGAEIEECSLPSSPYALSAYYIIASAEASSNLARFDGVRYGYRTPHYSNLTELYENTRSEGFGDEVKRRILLGTFVLSSGYYDAYYKRAKLMQNQIAREFADAFSKYDLLLTPTVPNPAFPIGAKISDPINMHGNDICTVAVNLAGLPAITLPCAVDADDMPVSLQLIGNHFSEQLLFDTATCCEMIAQNHQVKENAHAKSI